MSYPKGKHTHNVCMNDYINRKKTTRAEKNNNQTTYMYMYRKKTKRTEKRQHEQIND